MKIKIKLEYFKKIKFVAQIASNSLFKNENENILISCKDYHLSAFGSDGVTRVKVELPESENFKIVEEGSIYVNSKTLLGLIEKLNDEEIEIYKTEKNLFRLTCGSFSCDLQTLEYKKNSNDDFLIDGFTQITITQKLFKIIYKRFKDFCQTNNDSSKTVISALSSINISKKENNFHIDVCSTDAFRMVYGKFPSKTDEEFTINLLPSTINNILNFWQANDTEEPKVYVSQQYIIVKTKNHFIKSRLVSDEYPNVLQWFNSETPVEFIINKKHLIDALERILTLSSHSIRNVLMDIQNDLLTIYFKDGDKGTSKETIEIENKKNTNLEISVDSLFLKNLVRNIEDEKLYFGLISSLKPIIIKGETKDEKFKQIILPTRVY